MIKNKSSISLILKAIGIAIVVGAITGFIGGAFGLSTAVTFPISFVCTMAAVWFLRSRQASPKS